MTAPFTVSTTCIATIIAHRSLTGPTPRQLRVVTSDTAVDAVLVPPEGRKELSLIPAGADDKWLLRWSVRHDAIPKGRAVPTGEQQTIKATAERQAGRVRLRATSERYSWH